MVSISLGGAWLQVFRLSAKHMVVRLPIAAVRIFDLWQIIVLCLVTRPTLLIVEYIDCLDDLRAEGWWLWLHFQGYWIFCIQYHWILILTSSCVYMPFKLEISIVITLTLIELLRLLFLIRTYKLLILLDIIIVHVRVIRLIHGQSLIWLILWNEVFLE